VERQGDIRSGRQNRQSATLLVVDASRLEVTGIGETSVLGSVGSASDCIDVEADEDCITGC
jgi:hypothetical protein